MGSTPQRKAPYVRLKPNLQKILAAITHVIALGDKHESAVTQYDILKSLFIADRSHLNKYGRPITFDNYVAMKAGPVPSLAYDLLKENQTKLSKHKITRLPWNRAQGPRGTMLYSNANPAAFCDVLSESDQLALSDAYNVITSLTFSQVKRLTHSDPAYIEAWEDNENRKAFGMSAGMLFDSPDYEQAEAVAFLSEHM